MSPDIDIEAELDNVATKRDGSLVYIRSDDGEKSEKKVSRKRRPAERRGSTGKQKRDVKGLIAAARQVNAGG